MKSFLTFFEQAEDQSQTEPQRVNDSIVTSFGRHNPPHAGHGLALDKAHNIAMNEGADERFYTSQTNDPKKNPLPQEVKLKYLKKMFPRHADKWDGDKNIKTYLQALQKAHKSGYKNAHVVVGGDRIEEMGNLARKYNGNLYDFQNIYTHNAGERNEGEENEANPLAGLSASKQRRFAQNDDFEGFAGGLNFHSQFSEDDAKELFDLIKQFGEKNEDWEMNPRGNKQLIRELYTSGKLYRVGDLVESLGSSLSGKVHRCGANHLICVTEDGIMFKNFIHDVHHI